MLIFSLKKYSENMIQSKAIANNRMGAFMQLVHQ